MESGMSVHRYSSDSRMMSAAVPQCRAQGLSTTLWHELHLGAKNILKLLLICCLHSWQAVQLLAEGRQEILHSGSYSGGLPYLLVL